MVDFDPKAMPKGYVATKIQVVDKGSIGYASPDKFLCSTTDKFRDFEILAQKPTDASEQRKTEWIDGQSLENFLDPHDSSRTIEGYPAPRRIYVRLRA